MYGKSILQTLHHALVNGNWVRVTTDGVMKRNRYFLGKSGVPILIMASFWTYMSFLAMQRIKMTRSPVSFRVLQPGMDNRFKKLYLEMQKLLWIHADCLIRLPRAENQ